MAARGGAMSAKTRSPIKDKPLRLPGQSLEEERRKIWDDRLETPLIITVFLVVLSGLEWWRFFANPPPQPILYTIIALLAITFVTRRIFKALPEVRALKQGMEGERAVGQFLDQLREKGYHVFHDLIGESFNVDHVIIGPAGAFTIETKTWSKPAHGDARIKFDGEHIIALGREPDRNPVVQARAQASWLKGLLVETTGKAFEVFPVVVFPGWYVEQTSSGSLRNIWVLEPKALVKFLDNAARQLSTADVKLASFHLSRFIRSAERERSK
jgi:hypothetical protein